MPESTFFSLLRSAGVAVDADKSKIHLATHNGDEDPLNVYSEGRFKEWQESQKLQSFACDSIISLIKVQSDKWMFAGVYSVLGCEKEAAEGRYLYSTSLNKASSGLAGRLFIRFKRPGKQAYLWANKYSHLLEVDEVRAGAAKVHLASAASRGAYAIARRVFLSKLSPIEGVRSIHAQFGMNVGSARIQIDAYAHLRRGEVMKRGLSTADFEYYLSQIQADDGIEALQLAVHSLWQHIAYYENDRGIARPALREIASRYMQGKLSYLTLEQTDREFKERVKSAARRSPEERKKRLAAAKRIPERRPVVVLGFVRNEDVVVEVLLRAKGRCEACSSGAPFLRRKDRTPYLEVHHVVLLAEGGEDTVENAQALCPNCHRRAHFGEVELITRSDG